MPRQIPVPDEVSKPFWDACNERRLMAQKCSACDRLQHPPRKACATCGSAQGLTWVETSGRGTIDTYSVIHDGYLRAWTANQPYNVAVIQLEEDPTILYFSNLPGTPVDQVPVGARVRVTFEEAGPGQLVPEWRVAS